MTHLLRLSPLTAPERMLRLAIVEAGRIAYERGLLSANDGNLSVRLGDGRILITPSGLCKGRLTPGDLLMIDISGKLVRPAADIALKPTSEQSMHLEAYRQRADIHAMIHAHPPYAIALTVAGKPFHAHMLPEIFMLLGEIPITDYAMPSSTEGADAIREFIKGHDALVLRQHGSLTVGKTLDEALINLERLEHAAKVQVLAEMMGQITPWPAEKRPSIYNK